MKKMNPIWIEIDEDLLQQLLSESVESQLGYKLCKPDVAFNIDTGEPSIRVRVCGGPKGIECVCAAAPKEVEHKALPVHYDPINREEDY
jgi:signal transduction histidine kinase